MKLYYFVFILWINSFREMKNKKELHIFGGHETHAHGRSSQINLLYFLHLKQKRVLVECLGSSGWFDLKRSTFSGTKESKVQNYLVCCKFEVLRATVALLSDIRPLWLKTDDVKGAKREVVIFDRVEIGSIWQHDHEIVLTVWRQ